MAKDAMAFLDGETVEEPEVEETEVTEEPEAKEPQPEQSEPKAEDSKEEPAPEPEQKGEPEGETPAPEPQNDKSIPVTALLDEREKRQEAQRKAEEYDRQLRQLQAEMQRLQQPKQEAPDWYEDPQGAARFQNQQVEQQFQARLMQQSKFLAEREFGSETVNEAVAYFDRNPAASQQFKTHPSPFHAAVEFYQRQKVAEEIGTDPDAYKQKLREELRAELEAEYASRAPGTSKPKAPPPSMASAPASGGDTKSPGNGFDALFPE